MMFQRNPQSKNRSLDYFHDLFVACSMFPELAFDLNDSDPGRDLSMPGTEGEAAESEGDAGSDDDAYEGDDEGDEGEAEGDASESEQEDNNEMK